MTLRGVDFDFDPLCVPDMERYQTACAKLTSDLNGIRKGKDAVGVLRSFCAAFDTFFMDVLGAEYDEAAGVDNKNVRDLSDLAVELRTAIDAECDSVSTDLRAKITPSKQQQAVPYQPHGRGKRSRHR